MNILILGNLGSKHVFLKSISSHTHAFYSQNSMLWGVSAIFWFDFQKSFFLENSGLDLCISIDRICFWSIEIAFKISWLVLCVSINQKSYREFLKHWVSHVFFTIQTFSKLFLSLFDRSKGQSKFLSFSTKFLQGFLSSKGFWGFWCFKLFLSQLINGFLLWDNIKLFLVN